MPYIGNSPGTGTRNRFIYTATASQTTFSGADDNGKTLKYADSDYVDVYLNGICLVPVTDYTSTSKTSIVLTQSASLNDTLEVVAYDIATISDTVSKADGGTFEGDLGVASSSPDLTFTNSTSEDTDGGRESTVTFKGKQSGGEETTLAQIQASHDGTSDDEKGNLIFRTNNGSDGTSPTEAFRIDALARGSFGSGTSGVPSGFWNGSTYAPYFAIENNGLTAASTYVTLGLLRHTADSEAAQLAFAASRGTTTNSKTVVQSGDSLGTITFQGADGSEYCEGGRINVAVDGTPGSNDMPSRMQFYTTADGAQTPTERMRIDSSGNLLVGRTSTGWTGGGGILNNGAVESVVASGYSLFGRGVDTGTIIDLRYNNAAVGSISTNGSSTSYNTTSDYRLKENVTDVTDGITRVKQLAPKRFNFIADADTTVDGFLAHEAATAVPEAVTGTHNEVDDDGNAVMQGIDQSKLVPLLTAALKEAITKIEDLETRVAALEGA